MRRGISSREDVRTARAAGTSGYRYQPGST